MPSTDSITARYLTRFQCLGTACEEHCCQGWQVQIDRRHYQILKSAMDGSRAEREEFRAGVQRNHTDERDDGRYAWIRLEKDKQTCPFLSAKKLCSVQGRYGEEALPDICSTYPRLVSKFGDRLEVWGTLSCPEMARQCLLHEDAVEIVDATAAELTTRTAPTTAVLGTPTPYQRHLDDMRAVIFQLLSMREYPIGTRLFMVSYLGRQTAEFFNKSSTEVDEGRLGEVIHHVASPENVALWHAEISRLPAPDGLAAKLVTQMLRERLKVPMGSFRVLVDKILATFHEAEGVALDEDGAPTLSIADLWADYSNRRRHWVEHFHDRVDLYFENYSKNFWLREWFVTSPDLLAHSQRLLVRVALLRFLLFGHPSLKAAMSLTDPAAQRDVLDRAAVDVFYKFSRAIEHEGSFLDLLAARLVEQGMNTFNHATLLALM